MFLLRFIASWFLVLGVIALVHDGIKSLANGGGFAKTALGRHWFDLHPPSLNALQAFVERYISTVLWDPVLITLLQTPTWIVCFVLATALYFLGRKRRRTNIYAN